MGGFNTKEKRLQRMARTTVLGLLLATPCRAEKPAALPAGIVLQGDRYISPTDGAEMVYVPPGECVVGLPVAAVLPAKGGVWDTGVKPTGSSDLSASHVHVAGERLFAHVISATNLFVNGFFMDKFEVSNRRYKKFLDATGRTPPAPLPPFQNAFYAAFTWPGGSWFKSADPVYDGAEHPVACVTWEDAMAYAQWAGKTLPTELQWERAARGTNGWEFPWGNSWDPDRLNTVERGERATRPCGATAGDRSDFGVMDLGGNVAEWTRDEYAAPGPLLPLSTATNPAPRAADNPRALHVIKGGSWGYLGFVQSRAWYRRSNAEEPAGEPGPVPQSVTIGFRCVVPLP